jgi:hypothetical protein
MCGCKEISFSAFSAFFITIFISLFLVAAGDESDRAREGEGGAGAVWSRNATTQMAGPRWYICKGCHKSQRSY